MTDVAPPVGLPRLLTKTPGAPGPMRLAAHLERFGDPPFRPFRGRDRGQPDNALIRVVEAGGLLGRGGGGFPTARKMRAVAERSRGSLGLGRGAVVVANGAEGEPASNKDKAVMETVPHLVLDGLLLAAEAVGARRAIVCVEEAARRPLQSMERAIDERRAVGLDAVGVDLAASPTGYVVGEESALVHWLNGGPARPTFVPPRPFERGVSGRPTLVQNVETLAHLGLLARFGPDWFRRLGTPGHPGSALVTASGAVARPGVYEIAPGTPVSELVSSCGGVTEDPRAVLLGGYSGRWLDFDAAAGLGLADDTLRAAGASLGVGVVAVLPASRCGLAETARIVAYLARESAGQCGPCINGLAAIAGGLARLHDGAGGPGAEATLRRWSADVTGRGACHHPDGAVRLVASALEVFSDEITSHQRSGRCPAVSTRQVPVVQSSAGRS